MVHSVYFEKVEESTFFEPRYLCGATTDQRCLWLGRSSFPWLQICHPSSTSYPEVKIQKVNAARSHHTTAVHQHSYPPQLPLETGRLYAGVKTVAPALAPSWLRMLDRFGLYCFGSAIKQSRCWFKVQISVLIDRRSFRKKCKTAHCYGSCKRKSPMFKNGKKTVLQAGVIESIAEGVMDAHPSSSGFSAGRACAESGLIGGRYGSTAESFACCC